MFYSVRRGKSTKERRRATWREQGEGDMDDNNEEELGLWFHQAYMIEFRISGQNKGLKDIGKGRHEWQHSTHEDVKSEPRWITKGRHQYKLHGQFEFSHEGPWLHINEKVCEKVKLYDFKWSALREATLSFNLYILIWPSTLHSLIKISSNIVPLL